MNEWMNSSERASVERTTSVDANAETTKPIGIVCFVLPPPQGFTAMSSV